jgi:hypothetical protein
MNPIEEGFSAMKACLRHHRDDALIALGGGNESDPFAMLWEIVYKVMVPENIAGWYRDSGYIL